MYLLQCDVWACGVLAYELLVGRPPFEVADEGETRKKIMFETTIKFPPHVSAEAMNFIKTVLAKNAAMRPTATDLVHHAWLRPHLLALAQRASHLNAAELRYVPGVLAIDPDPIVMQSLLPVHSPACRGCMLCCV
jgi:serine/threonine protein kinase